MNTAVQYPAREPYFAYRVMRLLAKTAAAQTIGPEGAWLVSIIVNLEATKRYSAAVSFYNEQLMVICGFASLGRLIRTRDRVVSEGWLNYQPGGKRRPAVYFATIPAKYERLPDCLDDDSQLHFQNGSESPIDSTSIIEGKTISTSEMEVHSSAALPSWKLSGSANGSPPTNPLSPNTSPAQERPDEPLKARKRKTISFTPDDMTTAKSFWDLIVRMQPERKPPSFEAWANTIRLMREQDKREHAAILELFERVHRDPFWPTVILSPETLRQRWDDMQLKLKPLPHRVVYAQPLAELRGIGS